MTKYNVIVDDMGRVRIPSDILREYQIYYGMQMELVKTPLGYVLSPFVKSFEECCHEWWDRNHSYINQKFSPRWRRCGDYTMCVVNVNGESRCGVARRMYEDTPDLTVGAVASYARAMDIPVNELVGYKGG